MKRMFNLAVIALTCIGANADMLRLHDGRTFAGQFLGATRTEIWFQRDSPGDIMGTAAYPIAQVESLTFGPSSGPIGQAPGVKSPGSGAEVQPFWCASYRAQCAGGLNRIMAKAEKDFQKMK